MAIGIGTIIGGVSALGGLLNNRTQANRQARAQRNIEQVNSEAAKREQDLAARLYAQYQQRMGIADNAIKSGVYDPEKMVGRLDQDFNRNMGRTLQNMAGSYATMGYRPGDTEPLARTQAAYGQGLTQRNQQAELLRQNAPNLIFNLLNNAEGGLIGRTANMYGASANRLTNSAQQQYAMAGQQQGDMGQFLQMLMPFLNKPQVPDIANPTGSYSYNQNANNALGGDFAQFRYGRPSQSRR